MNRTGPKNPVPVYEVMTFLNQRSINGRVVINPPEKMAPLEAHQTGEKWYFCYLCGRSHLDQNKHLKHMKEHSGNDNTIVLTSYPTTDNTFHPARDSNTISRFDDYEDEYLEDGGTNSEDEPLINLYERKRKHKGKIIRCGVCHESFPKRNLLRIHVTQSHANDRRFTNCHKCGQVHLKRSQKTHEERNHNPANPFKCSSCVCRFGSSQALHLHTGNFHPEKFVPSTNREQAPRKAECSGSSSIPKPNKPLSVRKHSVPNEASVLYRCKKCQKTFKTLPALRGHFLIHTGEKPHECVLCSTRFRLSATLSKHKKVAHSGGSFACRFCPCTFHFQQGITAHVGRRHNDKEKPEDDESGATEEDEY